MLETIFYFLKTFGAGWRSFTSALGSTSLGFWIQVIGIPVITFIVTLFVVRVRDGKDGLMLHINKTLLWAAGIALAVDLVIYGPILGWKFVSAIYQDHVALAHQSSICNAG